MSAKSTVACAALLLASGCGGMPSRVAVPPPPQRAAAMGFLGLQQGTIEARLIYAPDSWNVLQAFYADTDSDEVEAVARGGGWRYYPGGTAPRGAFAGVILSTGDAVKLNDPTDPVDDEEFPGNYPFLELGYTELSGPLCWEFGLAWCLTGYAYGAAVNVGAGVAF